MPIRESGYINGGNRYEHVRGKLDSWKLEEHRRTTKGEQVGSHLRNVESGNNVSKSVLSMVRAANGLFGPVFGSFDSWYFRTPKQDAVVIASLSKKRTQIFLDYCQQFLAASKEVRDTLRANSDDTKVLDALDNKVGSFKLGLEMHLENYD